jgi:hypothetical protein
MRLYEVEQPGGIVILDRDPLSLREISRAWGSITDPPPKKILYMYGTMSHPVEWQAVANGKQIYDQLIGKVAAAIDAYDGQLTHNDLYNIYDDISDIFQSFISSESIHTLPLEVVEISKSRFIGNTSDVFGSQISGVQNNKFYAQLAINYNLLLYSPIYCNANLDLFKHHVTSMFVHEYIHYLQYCKLFAGKSAQQISSMLNKVYRNPNAEVIYDERHDIAEYHSNEIEIQAWAAQGLVELCEHYTTAEIRQLLFAKEYMKLSNASESFKKYYWLATWHRSNLFNEYLKRFNEQLDLYDQDVDPRHKKLFALAQQASEPQIDQSPVKDFMLVQIIDH